MSDSSQGPGWWLASDGKWYPPELRQPPMTWPSQRVGAPVGTTDKRWYKRTIGGVPGWFWPMLLALALVVAVFAAVLVITYSPEDPVPNAELGALAVADALGISLSNDVEVDAACELFHLDRVTFSEVVAERTSVYEAVEGEHFLTGDIITPTPADVIAWGERACE